MKRATKMLLMRSEGNENRSERGGNENRYEMDGGEREPNESRFRDRRGREHYDNGRYAPMRNEMDEYRGEMRYPYNEMRGNRERRFEYEEKRTNNDERDRPEMHYPRIPPYYEETEPKHRRIGFALENGSEMRSPEVDYNRRAVIEPPYMNETEHRPGGNMEMGHAMHKDTMEVTREKADRWMKQLRNEDGTSGPHWPFEKTKQVMSQSGINCDPVEFYVAMNMMYSDYAKVAKKLGINSVDFYSEMAKAFLGDKDAGPGKIAKYFEYVVGGEQPNR